MFINEILKSLKLKDNKNYKYSNRKENYFTSLQSDNKLSVIDIIKGYIITIIMTIGGAIFLIWLFHILLKNSPIFN